MNIERWNKLLERANLMDRDGCFQRLENAYAEKHRAYHTAEHIQNCLNQFDADVDLVQEPVAVELAIWFHDAIYKPYSKTNEADSAAMASAFLHKADAQNDLISTVTELIVATDHVTPPTTPDQVLLIDIDLSVLGFPAEQYAEYEKQVRYEYRTVPSFIFRRKRAKLLSTFLDRDKIYRTDTYFDRYEKAARINLQSAIDELSS